MNKYIYFLTLVFLSLPVYATMTEKEELEFLRKQNKVLLDDLKVSQGRYDQRTKEVKEEYALRAKLEEEKKVTAKDLSIINAKLIKDFSDMAEVKSIPAAMKELSIVGMSADLQGRFKKAAETRYKNAGGKTPNMNIALVDEFYKPKTPRSHKIKDTLALISEEKAKSFKEIDISDYLVDKECENFRSMMKTIIEIRQHVKSTAESYGYRWSLPNIKKYMSDRSIKEGMKSQNKEDEKDLLKYNKEYLKKGFKIIYKYDEEKVAQRLINIKNEEAEKENI